MKKIAVYGQVYKTSHQPFLTTLIKALQKNNIQVFINKKYHNQAVENNYVFDNDIHLFDQNNGLSRDVDALISLGGDGTILRAFNQIKDLDIPILGINLGRLGFLATVQENEIEAAVQELVKKNYTVQKRVMLEARYNENEAGEFINLGHALNDITIAKKDTNSMIGVDAYLNDDYLTTYWADGLIIATPTGSTGYSLSCQGPVIMPNTNNFVITPIAPHNLNARPIVIADDTQIRLKVLKREEQFLTSMDSRVQTMDVDTEILVLKSNYAAKIIELKKNTFINTLRDKLLWGYDKRNHPQQ